MGFRILSNEPTTKLGKLLTSLRKKYDYSLVDIDKMVNKYKLNWCRNITYTNSPLELKTTRLLILAVETIGANDREMTSLKRALSEHNLEALRKTYMIGEDNV